MWHKPIPAPGALFTPQHQLCLPDVTAECSQSRIHLYETMNAVAFLMLSARETSLPHRESFSPWHPCFQTVEPILQLGHLALHARSFLVYKLPLPSSYNVNFSFNLQFSGLKLKWEFPFHFLRYPIYLQKYKLFPWIDHRRIWDSKCSTLRLLIGKGSTSKPKYSL